MPPNAPTIVALIRHGQAAAPDPEGRFLSKGPVGLTAVGEQQSVHVGKLLRGLRIAAIHASDLLRARQTAEIIARTIDLPVEYDDQLREVDCGNLDGSTVEELERSNPAFLPWVRAGFEQGFASNADHLDPTLRFPGGESITDMAERAVAALRRICERHRGRCVVIVSHAWVTSVILCHVMDVPVSRYFRFGQPNAGLSVVRVAPDGRGMLDGLNIAASFDIVAGGSLPVRDHSLTTGRG